MTIKDLLSIKGWTPLKKIKLTFQDVVPGVSRISEFKNLYALIVDHDKNFERTKDAPFITSVIWADSEMGALHCTMNSKDDEVGQECYPPSEFLLSPESAKYGEILSLAKKGDFGKYLESADYKLPENYFVQRVITVGKKHSFYFRSKKDDMEEVAYAIKYKLES